MEKFFEYEDMDEEKKVNLVVTKLKGHAYLWWDGVREERRKRDKQNIKNWDMIVAKLGCKFFPQDYHLYSFRQIKNLRQILMSVREYTKEFYKVNTRAGYVQDIVENISRYMNGIRRDIQDEIIILNPRKVEEAYDISLKEEDKISRKQYNKGKVFVSGIGQQLGKWKPTTQRDGSSGSSHQGHPRDYFIGRIFSPRERGRGKGREFRC